MYYSNEKGRFLHIRLTIADDELFRKKAREKNMSLTEWITQTLKMAIHENVGPKRLPLHEVDHRASWLRKERLRKERL